MLRPTRRRLPSGRTGWLPLSLAMGGALLSLFPSVAPLEERLGLGLLYALRGTAPPPSQVLILGIDHESALRLRAPDEPYAWPRKLHAEILANARRGQAELVAFNIFFSGPSPEPGADAAMAEAMRGMGGAVLTDYVKPRQLGPGLYIESVVEPVETLAEAALATAPFLLPKDAAGANQFLTFFGQEGQRATLPTLLLVAHVLRAHCAALAGWLDAAEPGLSASLLEGRAACAAGPWNFEAVVRRWQARLLAQPELQMALIQALESRDLSGPVRRLFRSLARVLAGYGLRHFSHYGPARSFPTLPYYQLAGAPADEVLAMLRGKIVLVGYLEDFQPETTEGLFYTPFSPVSSVELAATALANLLEDQQVYPALSPLREALLLLAFGALLGLGAGAASMPRGLAYGVALGGVYLAVAGLWFEADGSWLPLAIPLGIQWPAGLLACLWLNYLRRGHREAAMQSMIHRFIPVDVFSQLTRHQHSEALPTYGRLAMGVCLATDAGRYTSLAETMEPMALACLMNTYYEAIFAPVTRHGGWISDVIGDAMLAIWIAEDGDDAKARRMALAAAAEVRQAVRGFEVSHGLVFPVRMGLHHGELRIGYVGTAERGEIRAVGDTVNTAARLEALNKLLGTQILAEQSLLDGIAAPGRVRPLGEFLLAGKSRPIAVAEVAPGSEAPPAVDPLHARFADALELFKAERWREAHAAFTLLTLQYPEDGPSRFYHQTCQAYLAEPTLGRGKAGIAVEKPAPAQLFNSQE
jgi:adenylate cyclase